MMPVLSVCVSYLKTVNSDSVTYGLYHYEYSLKGNLEAMIQIQSLSHRYPKAETAALDNVSFDIADGECLGLLGHNGAGKTTLMSLLAGLQEVSTPVCCPLFHPTIGHLAHGNARNTARWQWYGMADYGFGRHNALQ